MQGTDTKASTALPGLPISISPRKRSWKAKKLAAVNPTARSRLPIGACNTVRLAASRIPSASGRATFLSD